MTIALLLQDGLTADPGVVALVSTRVYPLILPQTPTYAAITYQRISSTGQDGSSDRRQSRWQINCWALKYGQTQGLAAAVKAFLEEWHDIRAVGDAPGIERARVVNEIDDYDAEVKVYRTIIDVMLHTTGD
jgi:hypothetical protein